ncbi:MAG: GDP-mannose 4,6-dehydratase [Candidatus Woesearchaeota archaeon]
MKKALITGITGQDGSYLSELLLDNGYEVYGMYRRCSVDHYFDRIEHLKGKINLVCGDLLDFGSLDKIIRNIRPDEIYNLAAQSQVRISFDQEFLTKEINWFGVERLLELVKEYVPNARFYQAATSEMFGEVLETPQNEKTPFNPVSPYAKAKLKAYEAVVRERKNGLFGCCGILFNHESPKRGLEFVTRKFTDGIVRIKLGLPQRETGKNYLEIGNLDAKRDWGYAGDYVEAMWLMLQQDLPDDYVISTNKNHSVREFIDISANYIGIKINWKGKYLDEEGYDQNGNLIIKINPNLFRPIEVNHLLGDHSKAKEKLGWKPKVSFEELVKMMIDSDMSKLKGK